MAELSLLGLRVLREVAACGSFTAAAETLGYTQSAVSRQVAGLESAAGVSLFERRTRGVRLTAAGNALLRHAISVLDELEIAQRELISIRELAGGRLRVGAFPTAVAALIPRALASFRRAHAGVTVTLREGTTAMQLRRLDAGALELAVVAMLPGQTPDRRHRIEPLFEDRLLLALARDHPLAQQATVDVEDLRDESWIAASTDADDALLGVWPSLEWQPRVAFVAREWTAKLGLVAAGLGITVVPGLAAASIREDIAVVRVRGGDPAIRTIAIATSAGAEQLAHVRACIEVLHEVSAQLTVELQRRIGAA
jgi:DNA-binding transcriptional LysR family regulator